MTTKNAPPSQRPSPLTAGLLGAGVAFLLSGLLAAAAPLLLTSYGFMKWAYGVGLGQWLLGDEAWAGTLPVPASELPVSGRLSLLLSACSFLAAFVSALRTRKRLQ